MTNYYKSIGPYIGRADKTEVQDRRKIYLLDFGVLDLDGVSSTIKNFETLLDNWFAKRPNYSITHIKGNNGQYGKIVIEFENEDDQQWFVLYPVIKQAKEFPSIKRMLLADFPELVVYF